jgi:hypothetical protein
MRKPKLHIVDVRESSTHREVLFSLDLDGMNGCSVRMEDASRGGLLPLSTDGGASWSTTIDMASGTIVGSTRIRSSSEDGTIFCYISDPDGTDTICAALVRPRRGVRQNDFSVSCNPQFVKSGDTCSIQVHGAAGAQFRLGIGDKRYGGRIDRKGRCRFKLTTMQMFSNEQISSYSLVRVPITIASVDGSWSDTGTDIHFVPSVLRTLAATNDPDRPGCVILDPTPNPSLSLRFDSQTAPCSNQAIVGPIYDPSGSVSSTGLTHLDSEYTSVGDGYSKKLQSLAFSCTPIDHLSSAPALFDPMLQRFGRLFPMTDDDDRGRAAFSAGAWVTFSKPDLDPPPPQPNCDIVTTYGTPVSRIHISKVPSLGTVSPRAICRGLINRPPAFLHSIVPTDSPSGVAAVVIRLAGGVEVSLSVPWRSNALEDLTEQINSDLAVSAAGVRAEVTSGRIDVFSDNRFSILAGQVSGAQGGNAINVYQFSGASASFRSTTIKNLKNFGVQEAGKVLFISGPFRGVVFDYTMSSHDTVRLEACPGINRPGGIIISDDIPCVHVAFLSSDSAPSSAVETFSLPIRRDALNQPVSCLYPAVSGSCRVVCQSPVDGKSQLFMYSKCPVDAAESESGKWLQLTHDGENRHPRVSEDRVGNLHLVWERDTGYGSYVAYATLGPDSGLFATKALVADYMRSTGEEDSPISTPDKRTSSSFVLDSSDGVLEAPFYTVNFLRGNLPSGSAYVKREYLGRCPVNLSYSANDSASFASQVKNASGSSVQLAGVALGRYVETLLVHIDPHANNAANLYEFNLVFEREILAVVGQGAELSSTDNIFSPAGNILPARLQVSFSNVQCTISSDKKSISLRVNLLPADRPWQIRVIVDSSSSPVPLRDGWIKIADSGASISMPRSDSVCLDYSPNSSKCCAILPYFSSDSGRQFDGTHKSFGYMIDTNVDIQPSVCYDSYVLSGSVTGMSLVVASNLPTSGVSLRTDFSGSSTISRQAQPESARGVEIDSDTRAIAGFSVGDQVVMHLIAVPPGLGAVNASISFNQDILSIETQREAILSTHSLLSTSSLPSNIGAQNPLLYRVSQNGRSLTLSGISSGSSWNLALVFTSSSSQFLFLRNSSEDAVADAYANFISSFGPRSDGLFDFKTNIMTSGRGDKEFSDFVPLVSSLRLNDLHENPSGVPQSSGLGYLNPGGSASYNLQCSDLVGSFYNTPSGATVTRPAVDGVDGVLYHYVLGVALETVRFFARNAEIKEDWCDRVRDQGLPCDHFYEGLSKAVYTGRAKLVTYLLSSESTSSNDRIPYSVERIESDHVFDVRHPFRLALSHTVVKDNEHAVRTSRLHLDPLRHEGSESRDSLLDKAHRAIIFASIDNRPAIAHDWRVDVTDGRRQFDICFGSFLPAMSWFRHSDHGYRNALAVDRKSVRFYDIDISDVRMSPRLGTALSPSDLDLASGFVQQSTLFDLVRNTDMLESSSDPSATWINMSYLSSAIDEWQTGLSGGVYGGEVLSRGVGARSMFIQPTSLTSGAFEPTFYDSSSYPAMWFWSPSRNRIVHGGLASFRQNGVFMSAEEYASTTETTPLSDSELKYGIYLRCKKGAKNRNDGSLVCPFDMTNPMLYVGSLTSASIFRVSSDNFSGISISLDSPPGDLFLCSFHPLYQKRADNIAVQGLEDGAVCAFVNSQGKFSIDSPNSFSPMGVASLQNRGCLAIQTNAAHANLDDGGGILICLVILDSGMLDARIRTVDLSPSGSAVASTLSSNFSTESLMSLGSSWRDMSVGSTFAACIDGGGSLKTIGILPDGWAQTQGQVFVSVACGRDFAVLIRDDGTLIGLGNNSFGQCDVPSGCFVAVGAYDRCAYAMSADGDVHFWGDASQERQSGVRAFASTSVDGIGFKGIDANGSLLGEESLGLQIFSPRVGFQGPFSLLLYRPGFSDRMISYISFDGLQRDVSNTIIDKYIDPFRSNAVVEHVSVVPISQVASEYNTLSVTEDFGYPIEYVSQFGTPFTTGGLSISRLGRNRGLQKSPVICVDDFAKVHCLYEDNGGGNWSVCYVGMSDWDRGLSDRVVLSNGGAIAKEPSIACDSSMRILAAWHERDKLGSRIAASVKIKGDLDFVDPCLVDRATSFIRDMYLDPYMSYDEYDPYSPPRSFSCDISALVRPSETGTYQFSVSLYDAPTNRLLLTSSSAQSPVGWYINGSTLNSEGQALLAGTDYEVVFDAVPNDIRTQNIIRWVITADTIADLSGEEDVEFVVDKSSANVEQLFDDSAIVPVLNGAAPRVSGPNVGLIVAQEQSGISSVEFPSRSPSDYIDLNFGNSTTNVSFPIGVSALPGLLSGKQYRSFIIHAPSVVSFGGSDISVGDFVQATLTFNAPIVGIVASPSDLGSTDGAFGRLGVNWRPAGERAIRFEDGEYIVLSANLRSLDIRLKTKARFGFTQLRVITSPGEVGSVSESGYMFCPFVRRGRCSSPVSYINTTNAQKLVHFRATVFADSDRRNALAVYTSKMHPSYWDAGRGSFPVGGVVCMPNNSISASFVPRFAPSGSVQSAFSDISSVPLEDSQGISVSKIQRFSLLPDTTYYLKTESEVDGVFYPTPNGLQELRCSTEQMNSYISGSWSGVEGRISYISPRGGFARMPHACAGDLGLFYIMWQDGRAGADYGADDPSGFRTEVKFSTFDAVALRWSSVDGEGGSRALYDEEVTDA